MIVDGRETAWTSRNRSTSGRMIEPGGGSNSGKPRQSGEGVGSRPGERMAGPHREDHLFRVEMLEVEAGHPLGLGETADHEVERAGAQPLQQDVVLAGDDPQRRRARLAD